MELVKDETRFRRTLAVIEHHVKTGDPINASCEACNLPVSTFYKYIADGVLDDYLGDCRKSRSETAAAMAAEAIPDITRYLVRVATGQVRVRGANPIAAAQLVLNIAGVKPGRESAADRAGVGTMTFMPQLVQFQFVQGMPAQDEEGRFQVIDGEAREVLPADEDPPAPAE
ncbi:MAG: hypothetical protein GWN58_25705 [Anaerolineae bacterium]|nr:hypothetical protein [Anaerolineae bacterium]